MKKNWSWHCSTPPRKTEQARGVCAQRILYTVHYHASQKVGLSMHPPYDTKSYQYLYQYLYHLCFFVPLCCIVELLYCTVLLYVIYYSNFWQIDHLTIPPASYNYVVQQQCIIATYYKWYFHRESSKVQYNRGGY